MANVIIMRKKSSVYLKAGVFLLLSNVRSFKYAPHHWLLCYSVINTCSSHNDESKLPNVTSLGAEVRGVIAREIKSAAI